MFQVQRRNNSIDIFRYICALMVVCIHAPPFEDINSTLSYVFTQIIPRIAVPFFFAVAGCFYFEKFKKDGLYFIKYLKKMLMSYALWSGLYLILQLALFVKNDFNGFTSILIFLKDYLLAFFFTGSYFHFWYFPALIISVILSTFIFKFLGGKTLTILALVCYLIGCLGCSYFSLGDKIPLFNTFINSNYFTPIRRIFFMGFPFFVSGYIANIIYKNYLQNKKFNILILLVFIAIWLAEVLLVILLKLQNSIVITIGLFPLVIAVLTYLLSHPMENKTNISAKCRKLANFTYYSHPIFILLISKAYSIIFGCNISQTILTILVMLCSFTVGFILIKINKKYTNCFL